jgi:hypothetical protein
MKKVLKSILIGFSTIFIGLVLATYIFIVASNADKWYGVVGLFLFVVALASFLHYQLHNIK